MVRVSAILFTIEFDLMPHLPIFAVQEKLGCNLIGSDFGLSTGALGSLWSLQIVDHAFLLFLDISVDSIRVCINLNTNRPVLAGWDRVSHYLLALIYDVAGNNSHIWHGDVQRQVSCQEWMGSVVAPSVVFSCRQRTSQWRLLQSSAKICCLTDENPSTLMDKTVRAGPKKDLLWSSRGITKILLVLKHVYGGGRISINQGHDVDASTSPGIEE